MSENYYICINVNTKEPVVKTSDTDTAQKNVTCTEKMLNEKLHF